MLLHELHKADELALQMIIKTTKKSSEPHHQILPQSTPWAVCTKPTASPESTPTSSSPLDLLPSGWRYSFIRIYMSKMMSSVPSSALKLLSKSPSVRFAFGLSCRMTPAFWLSFRKSLLGHHLLILQTCSAHVASSQTVIKSYSASQPCPMACPSVTTQVDSLEFFFLPRSSHHTPGLRSPALLYTFKAICPKIHLLVPFSQRCIVFPWTA